MQTRFGGVFVWCRKRFYMPLSPTASVGVFVLRKFRRKGYFAVPKSQGVADSNRRKGVAVPALMAGALIA
jgi:hypothetical protein